MIRITVNQLFKDLIALPAVATDETVVLTITKASGGTLAGGTFTYVSGTLWKLTFTPATLNEVYAVVVVDEAGDIIFRESYQALGAVYDAATGPSGSIVVGTNSWLTGQEAENYFATRYGIGTNWSALTDPNKVAALISAYNYLYNSGLYTFPTTVAEITQKMKDAQCEMALFLIIHQADMDARQGLQAQGVVEAGIVKEVYDLNKAGELAIPPMVARLLSDCEVNGPLEVADLERDEDTDVS